MFIIGTICCRGGSKGLPGKNVKLLNGKPLMAYTIETASKVDLLHDVIVSTDDLDISNTAKKYGIKKVFDRPAHLATDTSSKWLVFRHVIEQYENLYGNQIDYLVDLDVTVPLKTKEDISGAILMAMKNPQADVIITAYEAERNPYFNMMELSHDGFAEIVKKSSHPVTCRQDAPEVYCLTPAAYVIKRKALMEYEHWSHAKCLLYPIPRERAIDIDTALDFKFVEFILSENGKQKLI
ncbi:MAG: acylneuraminate cytidylyltransferase family protein [Bacteroidetes bacterium]|nr:acylneuraminate cytidylyltransferase family protein [Bacteroidota bacterium]